MKLIARLYVILIAFLFPLSASAQVFEENFDSRTVGTEVMFQEPRFSGSTATQIVTLPDTSIVSAEAAVSVLHSDRVNWAFLAGNDRWLRLTTLHTGILPNPTVDFRGYVSFDYLLLGPHDLLVSLGIRETGTWAALGANGGSAGTIEWVGSTTGGNAPHGKTLVASMDTNAPFRTLTFNLRSEPVCAFTGNGALYSHTNKGVLDSLGITQVGNFTTDNEYRLYLDNVRIVAVPEPAVPLVCGLAAFGLLGYVRLRHRRI